MMKQTSALAVSPSAASVTKYKISNLKGETEKGTQANMSFCCVFRWVGNCNNARL